MERFVKTIDNTNFRKSPEIATNIIRLLKPNNILQVIEEVPNSTWYKCKDINNVIGYITSKSGYTTEYTPSWLVIAKEVVSYGEEYFGTPYKFGSSRSNDITFDCSDFQKWIFKKVDIIIDADSRKQSDDGIQADLNNLRTGDLVFFIRNGAIYHVALYVNVNGQDRILHTYDDYYDIFDRDLNLIKENCGGVTYSDFSVGKKWRNIAYIARRVISGETFE